ncbi:hypothetical protein MVES1_003096 [Malassezia vespertilionis]|uniref:Xylanolytic transcriptional activator regulatory domain-containing protein n=1 Tax=Malassezia vespertilionis TaxID=2020962 RepID=A0A2N1J933_9BASI|nr:uncharacterized protein MVES1_003096 [Malassezia vespertilionis]PKI83046.1 hypothetical protein MVES_002938 [Malassezia vespertilionis]WFD07726.1 hypothetical protein MVES1_003096 [Malassezia vespertilionis]
MEDMLVSVLHSMHDGQGKTESDGVSPVLLYNDDVHRRTSDSPTSDASLASAQSSHGSLRDRLYKLVAAEGLDKRADSIRSIAEAASQFMQQVGKLDDGARERLMESKDEALMKSLLQNILKKDNSSAPKSMPSQPSLASPAESTRTKCLPDSTLNPLGLLAEASIQNWKRQRNPHAAKDCASETGAHDAESANSKKPGMNGTGSGQRSAPSKPQVGLANEFYFHSASTKSTSDNVGNADENLPDLLTEGVVTSEEAMELFCIFFHHCSLHIFLLDPEWHTPSLVCARCPFLFTCLCAVASKFYTKRPELYVLCLRKAIKSAFDILSRGMKSVEIVQGFLLLTLYNQPEERYEEDRTWLFAGVAIRMAQDLNLHRKADVVPGYPLEEKDHREALNRERTWYICFCVDRTLSAQMGKPYSIREDWIIRHSSEWCMQRYSRPWDLGICALVDLLRVQTRQLDFLYSSTVTPSGLNLDLDYPAILPSFNEQLNETMQFWYCLGLDAMTRAYRSSTTEQEKGDQNARSEDEGAANARTKTPFPFSSLPSGVEGGDAADKVRVSTLMALHEAEPPGDDADMTTRSMYYIARQAPLRYNYAVLVLNSFGLQYALERPSDGASVDKPQYFVRCVHAAKEIIATVKYGMREILRYAPDPTFVAVAYACVFLLKLIRPVFLHYINEEEVIALVNYTIEVLEEAAVDSTHTPALYASFLRSLVQSRQENAKYGEEGAPEFHAQNPRHDVPHMVPDPSLHMAANGMGTHEWRIMRLKQAMHAGRPNSDMLHRGAEMTVNPTQVNPVAASLAAEELRSKPAEPDLHSDTPETHDSLPSSLLDHGHALDLHGLHTDTMGWDALQYAKAQGVEVNRVLDTSFWTSLLPPGYGSGGMSSINGSSFDAPPRDHDFSKMHSALNLGMRTTLTPGATRASSPSGFSFPL